MSADAALSCVVVALVAGGGGIAAGETLLTLAGPVGWTIAGVALVASGVLFLMNREKNRTLEHIYNFTSWL